VRLLVRHGGTSGVVRAATPRKRHDCLGPHGRGQPPDQCTIGGSAQTIRRHL